MNLRCEKSVLFMGERITDVYHYGRLMNRPAKEPIQCIAWERKEEYAGGVDAAAAHAVAFGPRLHIASDRTISKVRFLESNRNHKLFEYYGPVVHSEHYDHSSGATLEEGYDVIAVCDYGHGMMTRDRLNWLEEQLAFRAACVQTNAGNYGFNLATKYRDLDYLCVDEQEARLATQNQYGPIEDSLWGLSGATTVCITLGSKGAIGIRGGSIEHAPAVSDWVRDTMGAGDAFFAVTALFAEELSLKDVLRLGNAAAAVKCRSVGQKAVTLEAVEEMLYGAS